MAMDLAVEILYLIDFWNYIFCLITLLYVTIKLLSYPDAFPADQSIKA